MGGRGAFSNASGGAGGTGGASGGRFANEADFEKSLTGAGDPRLKEYTNAQDDFEASYGTPSSLVNMAKNNGLSEWTEKSLMSDKARLQNELNNMPKNKTPAQLGRASAIKEYISAINESLKYKDNKPTSPTDNINIVN